MTLLEETVESIFRETVSLIKSLSFKSGKVDCVQIQNVPSPIPFGSKGRKRIRACYPVHGFIHRTSSHVRTASYL